MHASLAGQNGDVSIIQPCHPVANGNLASESVSGFWAYRTGYPRNRAFNTQKCGHSRL